MLVIGTAGHIDHGKSAIVKRLSGTDPDRLPEEQARGMTIDLGFAFLKTPNGHELGFVDVPGHERFVRNMIAGAGGIDAVLLVIAADDGWMPQSEEHFQIIRLLGVHTGLIVINKIDLVEPDWLELLEAEIREKVAGSPLAQSPIVRISATTGAGFDQLIQQLENLAESALLQNDIGRPRLYADRSFVQQGIGQVVTGTLRGGSLEIGQSVSIWPSRASAKVRTLQSRGEEAQKVNPGNRVAVSLTGADRKLMPRGAVITAKRELDYFAERPVLALSTELLKESPIVIENRRRALVLIGASETEGEIRLLDKRQIRPGESGVIFFKPDEPVFCLVSDNYILRLITPMITLGGGRVLDHLKHFPRQRDLESFAYLRQRLSHAFDSLVVSELQKRFVQPEVTLLEHTEYSREMISEKLDELVLFRIASRVGPYVIHNEAMAQSKSLIEEIIEKQLADRPHLKGLPAETIIRHSPLNAEVTMAILNHMTQQYLLSFENDLYNIAGRGPALKGAIKQVHDQILADLRADPYRPPTLAKLAAGGKNHRQAIKYMIETGEVYKCGSDFIFLKETWEELLEYIQDHMTHMKVLSPSDIRVKFDVSRKWVIPILEETDRLGITLRQGDVRVKGKKQ